MVYNNFVMQNKRNERDNEKVSDEEKQIGDLMYQYLKNTDKEVRIGIFESLSEYKTQGIEAINELIKVTGNDELVVYGLGVIRKLRESS